MSETFLDILRRAPGNTAGPLGFLLNENAPLVDFLRRRMTTPARPAETPATEPVAPAVSENPPSSFRLAQEEAARRRAATPAPARAPTEETPETFEAMRQFQAGLREQQMQGGGGGGQLSVLDMLRKRMARDMEGEALQRIGEFGAGMLASGSPNFFTMLGAGARAAREGDVSRMEQLRRLADLERQDAAQRAEEARRQEEIRLREEELRVTAPLRTAQAQQAEAMARFYNQGGSGAGRGQLTPMALAGIFQRAQAQALREFPDPPAGMPESEATRNERLRRRAQRAEEIAAGAIAAAGQTPAAAGGAPTAPTAPTAPAAPAAIIDLSGRPAR